jgi:ArsR family transcriptional regulator, arsenate/arsenite/antimonite-responsive transcriptional repressor
MEIIEASKALGALGQQTRLAIYRLLARRGSEGMPAGSIGEALSLAPATLSFHLRELAQAGLIRSRQQSRYVYYRADAAAARDVLDYLARLTETCREPAVDSPTLDPAAPHVARTIAKPVVRPKPRSA